MAELSQRQKLHRALLVILALVAVPAALFGAYKLTIGQTPLVGDDEHDFGYVWIYREAGRAVVSHTFSLTNRTSRPINLLGVRTSCGCTVSELSTNRVEPGESVEVRASLSLEQSGFRDAEIRVMMENRGVRTLRVQGIGRMEDILMQRPTFANLIPGRTASVSVFATIWPDEWPDVEDVPPPRITAPDEVEAKLVSWGIHERPRRDSREAHTWRAQIDLVTEEAALPAGATLVVDMGPEDYVRIPLVMSEGMPRLSPPSSENQPVEGPADH